MADQSEITVYWRPGCGFCAALLHRLDKSGLAHRRVNIWEDDDARQFVRSVASGNETVPTVLVAERVFVNPRFREVAAAVTGPEQRREKRSWWRLRGTS